MDREIRNLLHTKQDKINTVARIPQRADGSDGEMRLCKTSKGIQMFVKYMGAWYQTTLNKIGG